MKGVNVKAGSRTASRSSRATSNRSKNEGSQFDCCTSSSSPISSKNFMSVNYSPILSQATIEHDNVDVMWDWHSPRSKEIPRQQKRVETQRAPKLLLKKYPSNNQIPEFDKLNEELKSLASNVMVEDTEITLSKNNEDLNSNFDEVFNDSMEAQLIVCSQTVEKRILEQDMSIKTVEVDCGMVTPKRSTNSSVIKRTNNLMQAKSNLCLNEIKSTANNNILFNAINVKTETPNKLTDDSFDFALQALGDIEFSTNNSESNEIIKTNTSLERKQSSDNIPLSNVTKCTLEEIENKRRQALEKLQKKKSSPCETSPIKCSQEEIENKRLQAIAKLEAKKKQDIIEKNRQEALKRLEMNKKKRALQFQLSVQPVKLKK